MSELESADIRKWLEAVSSSGSEKKNHRLRAYLAELASKPKRQRVSVNLNKLDKISKDGENIIVPGKVLGFGSISKKINISAIRYSKDAIHKLKGSGSTLVSIEEMMKKDSVRIIV
ncbi:MAG: 50S ribosomal protein L18e [Candidatus Micrarchaeota archaeon]|nr:50S ribosomal protein L18e [Candidatus Micrarchaeota archaeon]